MPHKFTILPSHGDRNEARLIDLDKLRELVAGSWERNAKGKRPIGITYMHADAVLMARTPDEVRTHYAAFKASKDKLMPLIVGAVWPSERTEQGTRHTLSGYMSLDYDHPLKNKPRDGEPVERAAIDEWVDAIMTKAQASPYTLAAYRSPSRMGVKVLVRLATYPDTPLVNGALDKDAARHVRRSYYATYAATGSLLGLGVPDPAAKEPERLCYVAHDAHAYFNADAIGVPWVEAVPEPQPKDNTHHHAGATDIDEVVRRILKWARRKYPIVPGKLNNNAFVWACAFVRNDIDDTTANEVLANELGPDNLDKLRIYMRDARKRVGAGSDKWAWNGKEPVSDAHEADGKQDAGTPKAGLRRWTRHELHAAAGTKPRPVLTGINRLDVALGIKPGGVVLIGAEPGAGKSMFLVNLLLSMARTNPARSFIFYSAEMPADACMARMVQALAPEPKGVVLSHGRVAYLTHANELEGVTLNEVLAKGIEPERGHFVRNNGELLGEMHRRAADAGVELHELFGGASFAHLVEGQRIFDEWCDAGRIIIADDPRQLIELAQLRDDLAEATELELGAVFVDYATRVQGEAPEVGDARHAIVETSKQLTAITIARRVALFLASQIGRDAFKRDAPGAQKEQKERELRAECPTSHFDALAMREMAVADGDVFAESAQWYRDADVTILLHNPAQGANRARRKHLDAYSSGATPLFLRVGKVRDGAAVHDIVELGVELHRQRVVSDCPLPITANYSNRLTPRWYTKDEQCQHIEEKTKDTANNNGAPHKAPKTIIPEMQ